MDFHQLEVFIMSAQYLSFTEAAKQLSMVQSSVSHNIAMLETELSVKLFNRNRNKLELTLAGEHFLVDAYKLTSMARNSCIKMKLLQEGAVGKLNIGFVFPEMINGFLPNFISFHHQYPKIEIKYIQYDSITLTKKIEHNSLDIAFDRQLIFKKSNIIKWKSLYTDHFFVILKKDHSLAKYKKISPQMLQGETVLLMGREFNPGMFDIVNHLFMSNGITPKLNDSSNNLDITLMLAQMGMGVVIMPTSYLKKLPDDLVGCEIEDSNAVHEIGIAWNSNNQNFALSYFLKLFGIEKNKMLNKTINY